MKNQFTERESELIYFALSRMLDDFAIDGVQDVNDNDEINQIIDLREKFAQINVEEQSK